MKILILDHYYPSFLRTFYATHPGLWRRSYQDQWQTLMGECFGVADSYSSNLKKLGHEATEIITNNEVMQRQWARENGVAVKGVWTREEVRQFLGINKLLAPDRGRYLGSLSRLASAIARLPLVSKRIGLTRDKLSQILLAQLKAFKPDVLYVLGLGAVDNSILYDVKSQVKLIIGQNASYCENLGELYEYLRYYDLFLSSFPHYVSGIRELGKSSEYFRLGFYDKVLDYVPSFSQRDIDISFVGGVGSQWKSGPDTFEKVATKFNFTFWSESIKSLPDDSPLRKHYGGTAYGLDMYRICARSKIVLNRHADASENYANNCRLYEATGMGALLVTEMKDNLGELFEPDKEVVTYSSADEAVEKIQYYLNHESARTTIAKAGQERTLREHTYYHRMQELCEIISKYA
ncbi:MAG: glycosyltransferase [Desulfobacteraceae bacterium]|nr:glycosyltransferase [Desulfobacteraceae bacterium]